MFLYIIRIFGFKLYFKFYKVINMSITAARKRLMRDFKKIQEDPPNEGNNI